MEEDADSQISYKFFHQSLNILAIHFENRTLVGCTELKFFALNNNLKFLYLNCRQCCIHSIVLNELYSCEFEYCDPLLQIFQSESKNISSENFCKSFHESLLSVDPSLKKGELLIKFPQDVAWKEYSEFTLLIEFSLQKPTTGIHFYTLATQDVGSEHEAPVENESSLRDKHLFTSSHNDQSRVWFPCIDDFSERLTWSLEFTLPPELKVVSCGDLVDVSYTPDISNKIYTFSLNTPISACHIGFAIGSFESYACPDMLEVVTFCLPKLKPLLITTLTSLYSIFEFYEELLCTRFPFTCYKIVFVNNAYDQISTYASLSILSTNLLHNHKIIDQSKKTQVIIAKAVARQFFGSFISIHRWRDYWLSAGISEYLAGLFIQKFFGNNEYEFTIYEIMNKICNQENNSSPVVLFPHHAPSDAGSLHAYKSSRDKTKFSANSNILREFPAGLSSSVYEAIQEKSHFVFRIIEHKLGKQMMIQVLNKLLSLAVSASKKAISKESVGVWSSMLVSTSSFLKFIYTVTGKDLDSVMKNWVYCSGVAHFQGSYSFSRKRNVIEIEVKQESQANSFKYAGPLQIRIQEFDGSFLHTIQVEESSKKYELACHSKCKRNKKKKVALSNGEEIEMDLSNSDAESPILWIRLDPNLTMCRVISFEQPDYQWQLMLKYERDVCAQLEAITALRSFCTPLTRSVLNEIIENDCTYYNVRIACCYALKHVANSMINTWVGPPAMLTLFRKLFGSLSCPEIVKINDFSNFQAYFVQKEMIIAISQLRNIHAVCPTEVVSFLLDIVYYNDNTKNKFSDCYYRKSLIDALASSITPATTLPKSEFDHFENLSKEMKVLIKNASLNALHILQKMGYLKRNVEVFKIFTRKFNFIELRETALKILIDIVKDEALEEDLSWIWQNTIEDENESVYIKQKVILFFTQPPLLFKKKSNSPLDTPAFFKKYWNFMNTCTDTKLLCSMLYLFEKLYGRSRPLCLTLYSETCFTSELLPEASSKSPPITTVVTRDLENAQDITENVIPKVLTFTSLAISTSVISSTNCNLEVPTKSYTSDTTLLSKDTEVKSKKDVLTSIFTHLLPEAKSSDLVKVEQVDEGVEDISYIKSDPNVLDLSALSKKIESEFLDSIENTKESDQASLLEHDSTAIPKLKIHFSGKFSEEKISTPSPSIIIKLDSNTPLKIEEDVDQPPDQPHHKKKKKKKHKHKHSSKRHKHDDDY